MFGTQKHTFFVVTGTTVLLESMKSKNMYFYRMKIYKLQMMSYGQCQKIRKVSYLCLYRFSHNSPFPGGSCHKPSTSSPWRIHTVPVCPTSSDTA